MRRAVQSGPAVFAVLAASVAFVLAGCGGTSWDVTPAAPAAPAVATDGPAGTISGSVVEAVTGALTQASAAGAATKPSKGAKVSIPGTNLSTVTDENGEYTIVGVPEGVHEVLIEKDVDADGRPDLVVRVPDVPVTPDKGRKLPPVKADPPGAIAGTATLGGATSGNLGIVVFVPGTSYAAYADDAGAFTISGLPAGTWDVAAQKAGYEAARIDDVAVTSGETAAGIDFSLALSTSTRAGAVTGSARLVGASSHAGIAIMLSGVGATATTAEDGAYTLADVPEGIYTLTAAAEGYAPVRADNVIVLNGATYTVPRLYLTNFFVVIGLEVGAGVPKDGRRENLSENSRDVVGDEAASETDVSKREGLLYPRSQTNRTWLDEITGVFDGYLLYRASFTHTRFQFSRSNTSGFDTPSSQQSRASDFAVSLHRRDSPWLRATVKTHSTDDFLPRSTFGLNHKSKDVDMADLSVNWISSTLFGGNEWYVPRPFRRVYSYRGLGIVSSESVFEPQIWAGNTRLPPGSKFSVESTWRFLGIEFGSAPSERDSNLGALEWAAGIHGYRARFRGVEDTRIPFRSSAPAGEALDFTRLSTRTSSGGGIFFDVSGGYGWNARYFRAGFEALLGPGGAPFLRLGPRLNFGFTFSGVHIDMHASAIAQGGGPPQNPQSFRPDLLSIEVGSEVNIGVTLRVVW